jgi:hypothetical protein
MFFSSFSNGSFSSNDNFISSSSDEDILKNMNKDDGNDNFQFQNLFTSHEMVRVRIWRTS